jgi:hypothetical protein
MSLPHFRVFLAAASLVIGVPASAAGQELASTSDSARPTATAAVALIRGESRRDPSRVTREDLVSRVQADLLTLLQSYRPLWLRVRGRGAQERPEQVWVYLDGVRMGGVQALREISTNTVHEIHFMDGHEATVRLGVDHGSGAILVTSRI